MLFTAFAAAPYLHVTRFTALWISHRKMTQVFFGHVGVCVCVCVCVCAYHPTVCVAQKMFGL